MADRYNWSFIIDLAGATAGTIFDVFTVPLGYELQLDTIAFSTTHTSNMTFDVNYEHVGDVYPIDRVTLLANSVPDRVDIKAFLRSNDILTVKQVTTQTGVINKFVFGGYLVPTKNP